MLPIRTRTRGACSPATRSPSHAARCSAMQHNFDPPVRHPIRHSPPGILLPSAPCLPPSAYCVLPTAFCLLRTALRLLPSALFPDVAPIALAPIQSLRNPAERLCLRSGDPPPTVQHSHKNTWNDAFATAGPSPDPYHSKPRNKRYLRRSDQLIYFDGCTVALTSPAK